MNSEAAQEIYEYSRRGKVDDLREVLAQPDAPGVDEFLDDLGEDSNEKMVVSIA
jgi:hypothetical protein